VTGDLHGADGRFGHREHIALAWRAVRAHGRDEAATQVGATLRQVTAYERVPQKYNETMSRAWVELVAHHVEEDPSLADFDTFVARNPALLDKRLLARHYRSATLASPQARASWVEPDVAPFPWNP
jgi:hypothetical protein